MARSRSASVDFFAGYVVNRQLVVIASQLRERPEREHSRIFVFRGGQWQNFDVDGTVNDVYGEAAPVVSAYALGRQGQVFIARSGSSGKIVVEQLPESGTGLNKLGHAQRLRKIGATLYACGGSGQVYKRTGTTWAHFDDGPLDRSVLPPDAPSLFSIDGADEKNIYAVGQRGAAWYHDGKAWARGQLPAQDLNDVRSASPAENWICGDNGALFKGRHGQWTEHSVDGIDDFSAVEPFKGKVYLAGMAGLYEFDGKAIVPVDTGLDPAPDAYRLHAADGVLWSFGPTRLAMFDGKTWSPVPHPDNP